MGPTNLRLSYMLENMVDKYLKTQKELLYLKEWRNLSEQLPKEFENCLIVTEMNVANRKYYKYCVGYLCKGEWFDCDGEKINTPIYAWKAFNLFEVDN